MTIGALHGIELFFVIYLPLQFVTLLGAIIGIKHGK